MSTSVVDKLKVKQQVQLVWTDLGYAVNIKGGPKPLISGMSGHASPGQLLAVMGSSGAGKTTLLNVLSGRSLPGNITGFDDNQRQHYAARVLSKGCRLRHAGGRDDGQPDAA